MPPRAVFFDLDLTLVYMDRVVLLEKMTHVCNVMAQRYGFDPDALLGHHRRLTLDLWTLGETGIEEGRAVMLKTWEAALKASGCVEQTAGVEAADLYWNTRLGIIKTYDDAGPCLQALHGRLPLGLITNGPSDMQLDKLAQHGLERHFELYVPSGSLGILKPDRRIFDFACEKLALAPQVVWHVGDSLTSDVAGAKAAGLTAVWLNRDGAKLEPSQPQPDHVISSLAELPLLLNGA